ncbi:hypothetical protein [Deinococcus sp. UYEF24]
MNRAMHLRTLIYALLIAGACSALMVVLERFPQATPALMTGFAILIVVGVFLSHRKFTEAMAHSSNMVRVSLIFGPILLSDVLLSLYFNVRIFAGGRYKLDWVAFVTSGTWLILGTYFTLLAWRQYRRRQ